MKKTIVALFLSVVVFTLFPLLADAQIVGYHYFPTASEVDARFLSIAGDGVDTIVRERQIIRFAARQDTTAVPLVIGIFDGNGVGRWDLDPRGNRVDLKYELFADPLGDGLGADDPLNLIETKYSWLMPDKAWEDFSVIILDLDAVSPSGNYFFVLIISAMQDPNLDPPVSSSGALNNFKVRSNNLIIIPPDLFAFIAGGHSLEDGQAIYPDYPSLADPNYDGTWDFHFYVRGGQTKLVVWDGDFDHGWFWCSSAEGLARQDTDDPDTPNEVAPPWADGTTVTIEGVAVGTGCSTGRPPDDGSNPDLRFSPDVRYDIEDPEGSMYANDNPSGNRELEKFHIEKTSVIDPDLYDYPDGSDHPVVADIPQGTWHFHSEGLDINNLNALKFTHELCVPPAPGEPCDPVYPFLIGDTVFFDSVAEDGVQGPGEPGIAGVVVNLVAGGVIIETATTDANGEYSFEVPAGTHTVEVDDENFLAGGALEGTYPTTDVQDGDGTDRNDLTFTVVDDNVWLYDFGYNEATGQTVYLVGDTVFYDTDGDGFQDPVEPGIAGVEVNLVDADNVVVGTAVTDANGKYSFLVIPGTWTVVVTDANFLPGGALEGTNGTSILQTPTDINKNDLAYEVIDEDVDIYDFGYVGCGDCEGQITWFTFQYLGSVQNANVRVYQVKGKTDIFNDVVVPGETFTFYGTWKRARTMGTEIKVYVDDGVNELLNAEIHTSCSAIVDPGTQLGDFLVVAGASRVGGLLCAAE